MVSRICPRRKALSVLEVAPEKGNTGHRTDVSHSMRHDIITMVTTVSWEKMLCQLCELIVPELRTCGETV